MDHLEQYADFLFHLRQENRTVDDIPAEFPTLDLSTAYQVQDILVAKLIEARRTGRFGYKIGCTSEGAQQLLNTDGPVFAQMLTSGRYASPVTLDTTNFSMMIIEPEFAFSIKEDVPDGRYDASSIRPFIAETIPSIEIVHHHLGGWDRFDAPKTVADNAIHAAWVAGPAAADWQSIDFPSHEVKLFADDELVAQGRGEIALGSPLNALAWIANTLPQYGRALKAGEIVTTGVCMPVYAAQVGQTIRADFGVLGNVQISFE